MTHRIYILALLFLHFGCVNKDAPCCPSESVSEQEATAAADRSEHDCDTKDPGDESDGQLAFLGGFCVEHADCALGACIGQRCAVGCDAFNTTCPGDTVCEITGDIAGFCFHPCDTSNMNCPQGLLCNEEGFCEHPNSLPNDVDVPPNCCASDSDCDNGSCYNTGEEDGVGGTCRFLPRDQGCWSDGDCGIFACEGSSWPETMCSSGVAIESGSCVPTPTSGTVSCGPSSSDQNPASSPGHYNTCIAGKESCWDCARINPNNGILFRSPSCGDLGVPSDEVCEFQGEGQSATASKQCDGDEDCALGTSCFWFESANARGTKCTSPALCEGCRDVMKVCRNDSDCAAQTELCLPLNAEGRHQFSQQIFVCQEDR